MQFRYFIQDINKSLGKHKLRVIYIVFSRSFVGLFSYRVDRGLYSIFGKIYPLIRMFLIQLFNLMQAYSNMDISYKADIRGGLKVLHPSVGIVISSKAIIGSDLTLTGGNVIGANGTIKFGDILIGDNCTIGANATIIGPIRLSNNINIGASACVVKDCCEDNSILAGVPAKPIIKK